jgi:hypothetical protein
MDGADDLPVGEWLTLRQLAASRNISKNSAERLVRRHKWRRQPGNDGFIRVLVPPGEEAPQRVETERPDRLQELREGVLEVIRPLQQAIGVLEAQLSEANARAAKAEQAAIDERLRADRLQARLEDDLQVARKDAEALRRREDEWWRQGRLRRVLAVLRRR